MNYNPADLLPGHANRSSSFENPSGAASSGGLTHGGRKGAPFKILAPGERVVLADFAGPGTVTHIWMTLRPLSREQIPEALRAQLLEVFYDDLDEPSVAVPVMDFFGVVHGTPAPFASALNAANEGLGFSSRIPMPFHRRLRAEWVNASPVALILYYQVDVLLGPVPASRGVLHATFRRENPTSLGKDFVVFDGIQGPGRFLGWTGGVRVLDRPRWWGEGEMKFYIDGESEPTICGTGTEDYLDSAWGLGTFHAPETGSPLVHKRPGEPDEHHELISFYRWHLSDPIVFERSLTATIQQIGAAWFFKGQEAEWEQFRAEHTPAGDGWHGGEMIPGTIGFGIYEREDDWCGTAFVYAGSAQPVPRVDVAAAIADLPAPGSLEPVVRSGRPTA